MASRCNGSVIVESHLVMEKSCVQAIVQHMTKYTAHGEEQILRELWTGKEVIQQRG